MQNAAQFGVLVRMCRTSLAQHRCSTENGSLYSRKKGVDLPSNFSSVGYIEFEKDKLDEKGIDLFRELVSMKILNISVS